MIIKGSSRAGPSQLARHLQRTDTNERVKILQLDSPTGILAEAFRDWQLIAAGTRGSKGLYHANIDPDARYTMTPEQWRRSVDTLEKELGLTGQPRAVVMHEKHGRAHIHVVWQRTDIETMTLVSDSFNYKAHERASLALEQEFGHEHVPGKHAKRDREKQPEPPKAEISHAEWQQGERAGIDPRAFKEAVTALYQRSDNGKALQAALGERGLVLAKGDRRDYVIVDETGQVYSLARQIKGVTAKELRAFMNGLDRDAVPSVEQAKILQEERTRARQEPSPANQSAITEELARMEAALKARHDDEGRRLHEFQKTEHEQMIRVLDGEIAEKLDNFDALQQVERDRYARENKQDHTGIAGVFAVLKELFRPELAAAETKRREEAASAFKQHLEQERAAYIESLNAAKERDLADLEERHAQQHREHDRRYDEDFARYIREEEAAKRLAAEMEERQRRMEEQRSRDGPKRAR